MRMFVLLLLVLCSCQSNVKPKFTLQPINKPTINKKQLKVAIIDSGLDLKDPRFKNVLCKEGHKDFTGEGFKDRIGHGTHIAGLVKEYAKNTNYCLVIFKYYSYNNTGLQNLQNEIKSLKEVKRQKIDIVNLSEGGDGYYDEEYQTLKSLNKTIIVTATGNEGSNIDKSPYYPASYKLSNIIKVGNINKDGSLSVYSNYSKNMSVEVGVGVKSTFPDGRYGYMSGTSQAAAIHTGKLIHEILTN